MVNTQNTPVISINKNKLSMQETRDIRNVGLILWSGRSWSMKWQPTPVFFPVKSHGQRSLAGCSP